MPPTAARRGLAVGVGRDVEPELGRTRSDAAHVATAMPTSEAGRATRAAYGATGGSRCRPCPRHGAHLAAATRDGVRPARGALDDGASVRDDDDLAGSLTRRRSGRAERASSGRSCRPRTDRCATADDVGDRELGRVGAVERAPDPLRAVPGQRCGPAAARRRTASRPTRRRAGCAAAPARARRARTELERVERAVAVRRERRPRGGEGREHAVDEQVHRRVDDLAADADGRQHDPVACRPRAPAG